MCQSSETLQKFGEVVLGNQLSQASCLPAGAREIDMSKVGLKMVLRMVRNPVVNQIHVVMLTNNFY